MPKVNATMNLKKNKKRKANNKIKNDLNRGFRNIWYVAGRIQAINRKHIPSFNILLVKKKQEGNRKRSAPAIQPAVYFFKNTQQRRRTIVEIPLNKIVLVYTLPNEKILAKK